MYIQTRTAARRALLLHFFLFGFVISSVLSRFPDLKQLYLLSSAELSLVLFFMSVGSLIIMPVCAFFVGKYGSKKLSLVSILMFSLFALFTQVPNTISLYVIASFFGASIGLSDVALNSNSLIVEKAYKRPIIGLFHAFYYFGVFSGAWLSILFLKFNISIQWHHFSIAIACIIAFLFLQRFYLKETPVAVHNKSHRISFPKNTLLLIAFIAFFGRIIEGAIADWSTVYMNEIVELSTTFSPLGLAIYAAFIAVGRFFSDFIRSRYRDDQILVVSCLTSSLGIALMISYPHVMVVIPALFICGIGLSNLIPIIYSIAGNQKGLSPGVGLATINSISGFGFLFGPSVIGFIAEKSSLRVSFAYVLVLALIMVYLTLKYKKKQQTQSN